MMSAGMPSDFDAFLAYFTTLSTDDLLNFLSQ